MNHITPEQIKEYVSRNPTGIAGNSKELSEMVNYFAEQVVQECANRLRETDYELMFVEDGMCDPSISDAMLVAASDIEEHFGVES